jgi:hypothetical protein
MAIEETSPAQPQQESGLTGPLATADLAASPPVRTVVADRSLLDRVPFSDKPTAITAGLRERAATAWTASSANVRTGYWECGTGTFTGVRDGVHEVCYIVSGRATLRDVAGGVTEISVGSILVLPDGWTGTWEIHEPVEKVFVMIHG